MNSLVSYDLLKMSQQSVSQEMHCARQTAKQVQEFGSETTDQTCFHLGSAEEMVEALL